MSNNRVGPKTCFICGCRLNQQNRTEEHVYPKWLQQRFQLTNKKLRLLNGSIISYRQLTVPCCKKCNGEYLQPIETAMSKAVRQGPQAVRELGEHRLFIWLGKIFYGTLYRELSLRRNLKTSSKRSIFSKEQLKKYASHRMFLRSACLPIEFRGFFPSSILILKTQELDDAHLNWDYSDDRSAMFVGCRMGKVGIVCTLQDGGVVKSHFPRLLRSALSLNLHPIQFREVMTKVRYLGLLFRMIPKYVTFSDGKSAIVTQTNLTRYNNTQLFRPWNQREYCSLLSFMTGIPKEYLFSPPDGVWSCLTTANGNPQRMSLKRFPVSDISRSSQQFWNRF